MASHTPSPGTDNTDTTPDTGSDFEVVQAPVPESSWSTVTELRGWGTILVSDGTLTRFRYSIIPSNSSVVSEARLEKVDALLERFNEELPLILEKHCSKGSDLDKRIDGWMEGTGAEIERLLMTEGSRLLRDSFGEQFTTLNLKFELVNAEQHRELLESLPDNNPRKGTSLAGLTQTLCAHQCDQQEAEWRRFAQGWLGV